MRASACTPSCSARGSPTSRARSRPRTRTRRWPRSASVADWSGGTRIATSLHAFNKLWARRVLTQGAIVLLITDGLERDPDDRLAFEIDRLHRSCRRLIWLNPLLRFAGFEARRAASGRCCRMSTNCGRSTIWNRWRSWCARCRRRRPRRRPEGLVGEGGVMVIAGLDRGRSILMRMALDPGSDPVGADR